LNNSRILILILICLFLLVSAISLEVFADGRPILQEQEIFEGSYSIVPLQWQVVGSSTGNGYTIFSPKAVSLTGSGCCCVYLPCVIRNPK
jgi:hypothetical protein